MSKKKPAASDETISSLMLRLKPEDGELLEGVHARVSWTSRSAVALAALRLGLRLLDEDPTKLLEPKPKAKK